MAIGGFYTEEDLDYLDYYLDLIGTTQDDREAIVRAVRSDSDAFFEGTPDQLGYNDFIAALGRWEKRNG